MRARLVRMSRLGSRWLKVKKPLTAKVVREGPIFVARLVAPTLLCVGSGPTESVALRHLAMGITTQYELLTTFPRSQRLKIHAMLLRGLRAHVEEVGVHDTSESRDTATKKTRVRKASRRQAL